MINKIRFAVLVCRAVQFGQNSELVYKYGYKIIHYYIKMRSINIVVFHFKTYIFVII